MKKVQRLWCDSDPMTMGGAIRGIEVHRPLLWGADGTWEVMSSTPTNRTRTLQLVSEDETVVLKTSAQRLYWVELRLCTEEDLKLFLEEELSRN